MKIALLGPYPLGWQLSPDDTPVPGGVDAVVLALARGLAQRSDLQVRVITAEPGRAVPRELAGEGYDIAVAPHPPGGRLTGQRRVIANLSQQIAEFAPDVAHAHIAGIYGRAALASGYPSVVTLHGIIYREMRQAWAWSSWPVRLRWLVDAWLERAVTRQVREIIAISPYVREEAQVGRDARFHLIENPVDERFLAPAPPPPGADRLVCVARVIPRKGLLLLIEAFALARAARPGATLVIAGETDTHPAYVALCRRRAAELGVSDAITWTGATSLDAVRRHLVAADVFVLASEQETAPVSIAEAMAVGRVVVATDVGGCRWMVRDGVTGCIAPPRDARALAGAIIAVLAAPARCAEMGRAGREEAQRRFALGPVVDATVTTYRAVIDCARRVRQGAGVVAQ